LSLFALRGFARCAIRCQARRVRRYSRQERTQLLTSTAMFVYGFEQYRGVSTPRVLHELAVTSVAACGSEHRDCERNRVGSVRSRRTAPVKSLSDHPNTPAPFTPHAIHPVRAQFRVVVHLLPKPMPGSSTPLSQVDIRILPEPAPLWRYPFTPRPPFGVCRSAATRRRVAGHVHDKTPRAGTPSRRAIIAGSRKPDTSLMMLRACFETRTRDLGLIGRMELKPRLSLSSRDHRHDAASSSPGTASALGGVWLDSPPMSVFRA